MTDEVIDKMIREIGVKNPKERLPEEIELVTVHFKEAQKEKRKYEKREKQKYSTEPSWSVNWDAQLRTEIRPAQHFDGHTLWFGAYLPCKNQDGLLEERLVLINSKKECIPVGEEQLRERGIKVLGYPALPNRWSKESIKAFLDGAEPPDKTAVFESILTAFSEYCDFGDARRYAFHAAWDLGTYCYTIFNAFPYSDYYGMKQTGKSKTLNLIALTAFNGRVDLNPTESGTYRIANQYCPTQCFDEYDHLNDEKRQTINQILRSGYKKGGSVPRQEKVRIDGVGEVFQNVDYEVNSPKAFAGTFELKEISDRCIRHTLLRTTDKKIKNNELNEFDQRWSAIRDSCYLFALHYASDIKELSETFEAPAGFDSRVYELWKPLLVISSFVGPVYYEQILSLAKDIERERREENLDTEEYALVKALSLMVEKEGGDHRRLYTIDDVKGYLRNVNAELYDWDDPKKRRSIHTRIGYALSRLKITSSRVGAGKAYEITPETINELRERLDLTKTTDGVSCVSV